MPREILALYMVQHNLHLSVHPNGNLMLLIGTYAHRKIQKQDTETAW